MRASPPLPPLSSPPYSASTPAEINISHPVFYLRHANQSLVSPPLHPHPHPPFPRVHPASVPTENNTIGCPVCACFYPGTPRRREEEVVRGTREPSVYTAGERAKGCPGGGGAHDTVNDPPKRLRRSDGNPGSDRVSGDAEQHIRPTGTGTTSTRTFFFLILDFDFPVQLKVL